jgi:hypothetical protein
MVEETPMAEVKVEAEAMVVNPMEEEVVAHRTMQALHP